MTTRSNSDVLLPQAPWKYYEGVLQSFAEENELPIGDDYVFLQHLGFITEHEIDGELTPQGTKYHEARWIKSDNLLAKKILKDVLLQFPPVEAILQLLHGVNKPTRANALSILKSRDFWFYSDETPLTHLLLLMNQAELISYSKKLGTIKLLHNVTADEESIPNNIFIEPNTPFSNKQWLRRILKEGKDYIYWLDKHFTKEGLVFLAETADANNIKKIRILSLYIEAIHNKGSLRDYTDLKKELANKGIDLEWKVIDSKEIRDTHDRWIITKDKAWNLPDINTVVSGNRSEINTSGNSVPLKKIFETYLQSSKEITS